jgi:hypothetical protein
MKQAKNTAYFLPMDKFSIIYYLRKDNLQNPLKNQKPYFDFYVIIHTMCALYRQMYKLGKSVLCLEAACRIHSLS